MSYSPEMVTMFIPLMKDLGMRWADIKETPRHELNGLLSAHAEYETFHSMAGYSEKDIREMAKDKPEIRSKYIKYMQCRRKYEEMLGGKRQKPTFKGIV